MKAKTAPKPLTPKETRCGGNTIAAAALMLDTAPRVFFNMSECIMAYNAKENNISQSSSTSWANGTLV